MIRPLLCTFSILRQAWWKCCRKSGSRPASTKWAGNGSRVLHAIRNRIEFSANASEWEVSYYRKTDVGWKRGWRKEVFRHSAGAPLLDFGESQPRNNAHCVSRTFNSRERK